VAALAGCHLQADYGDTHYQCDLNDGCPDGFSCVSGLCQPDGTGTDASATDGAAVDATGLTPLARDDFDRTVDSGWGSADVGGAWSYGGASQSLYRVAGDGQVVLSAPAIGQVARLEAVSSSATDITATITTDKVAEGGNIYLSLLGRYVPPGQSYDLKLIIDPAAAVHARLNRRLGAGETALQDSQVPGLTFAAGMILRLRLQVYGTNPTQLRAKVWSEGNDEPADWLLSADDSTSELQVSGSVGLYVYLSSNATNAPVLVSLDDLLALPTE
jgi:hypothetical protein